MVIKDKSADKRFTIVKMFESVTHFNFGFFMWLHWILRSFNACAHAPKSHV